MCVCQNAMLNLPGGDERKQSKKPSQQWKMSMVVRDWCTVTLWHVRQLPTSLILFVTSLNFPFKIITHQEAEKDSLSASAAAGAAISRAEKSIGSSQTTILFRCEDPSSRRHSCGRLSSPLKGTGHTVAPALRASAISSHSSPANKAKTCKNISWTHR